MSFWNDYLYDLKELEKLGANIFCIGYSTLKRPIFCVRIGNGKTKILVQYCIHAREHITYFLGVMQAKRLLKQNINASVFLILLPNPDGVCLAKDGLKSVDELNLDTQKTHNLFPFCDEFAKKSPLFLQKIKKFLLKTNNSPNFDLWKANINGVDLNVNFDAKWGRGKQNVFTPSKENYVGKKPCSEVETKVLTNFVCVIKPNLTISYHAKGEVIYFLFGQKFSNKKRDKLLANEIANTTGYKLKKSKGSTGGFKDFCIQNLKIPSFTIEVGKDTLSHPISKKHILKIWQQNKDVIFNLLAKYEKLNYNKH